MKKISPGFLLPSAAVCVPRKAVRYYERVDKAPEVGDLVYGRIAYLGFHSTLENKQGRIHVINDGSRAVFVFGNRYAPDAFEGVVPRACGDQADMLARSGIVGTVRAKNANVKDPTRVEMLGYVCGKDGKVMNTLHRPMICDPRALEVGKPRARLVLVVGTSMNSGKSMTAAMACWAISAMGHKVRGCKVTGTAGLKDILRMEDAGASPVADFTYFGHPSTYLLSERDVIGIFDKLDRKYANNPSNYWVVEIADGILQRETVCLLASDRVRSRIHRLLFAAGDAMGAIAGLRILDERFGLTPHAISGICSASPLAAQELRQYADIPVISNTQRDLDQLSSVILADRFGPGGHRKTPAASATGV